jgi:two-component system, cell cycle sensor histidine kinase and response regulator CckA
MGSVANGIVPGGSETVLVVEDESAILRLISAFLEGRGYRVVRATTAAEAIEALERTGPVDLLLVDLHLPDMAGTELAERLAERQGELKLLYISGDGEHALDLGMAPYERLFLSKPFSQYELAWRVREVLDAAA